MYPQRRLRRPRLEDFIGSWNPDEPIPLGGVRHQVNEIPLEPAMRPRIDLGAIDINELPARQRISLKENMPLVHGVESGGQLKMQPKKGFMGRLGAGFKTAAIALSQGVDPRLGIGGLIGQAIGGFGAGAADPSIPAHFRRQSGLQREAANMERDMDWRNRESIIQDRESQVEARLRPKIEVPDYGWIPDPNNPDAADVYAPLTPGTRRVLREKPEKEMVEIDVPGGPRLRIPHTKAADYYGQVQSREERAQEKQTEREARLMEGEAKREAKLIEAADLISNAEIYENNANEAEAEARRFSDPNNYNELAAQDAAARARENRAQANILRRQAASARSEAGAIPKPSIRATRQSRVGRQTVKPKSDPLGLF